jgi:serine/threonine protein kinase
MTAGRRPGFAVGCAESLWLSIALTLFNCGEAIYEIGESEGTNFIATEFVDGLTLSERIGRGAISTDEALKIAEQIASALSAAHAAGINNRDNKSANIMIRVDGLVKVLDFGIAKYEQPEKRRSFHRAPATLQSGRHRRRAVCR